MRKILVSLLYRSGPGDFILVPISITALLIVGLFANLAPAVRAARTNPAISLRQQ
jgi:ABC-type antimicrobial peptide transport system permease subunit